MVEQNAFLAEVAELRHGEHGEIRENFSGHSVIQGFDVSDGGELRELCVT